MPDSALLLICSYSRLLELCLSHEAAAELVVTMLLTSRSLGASVYCHPPSAILSPVHGRSQAYKWHSVKQVLRRCLVERSCGRSRVGLWRHQCSAAHQAQPCADHPVCSGHWGAPHCPARKASDLAPDRLQSMPWCQHNILGKKAVCCIIAPLYSTSGNARSSLWRAVACHELHCSIYTI